jgi:hypothetical protein
VSVTSYKKDPGEELDYVIDWSDWLDTENSEEIFSSSFNVEAGLTKDSQDSTTTTSIVWLSGGSAGEEYRVECTIVTNNSPARTGVRSFAIVCEDR